MEILPSILTDDPSEARDRLEQLDGLELMPQIDFMDGQFVPSKSIEPEDVPEAIATTPWEAHLMVLDPLSWSPGLYAKNCQRLYWHVEVLPEGTSLPRSAQVEHGLALRLETPVEAVDPYLSQLQSVLLLAIDRPGYQGEQFQPAILQKIKALKDHHPHLKITVDGGVKLEHMKPLTKAGVDRVVVGSAFWQYGDPKAVLAALRQATL